jgi:hypothetical protein
MAANSTHPAGDSPVQGTVLEALEVDEKVVGPTDVDPQIFSTWNDDQKSSFRSIDSKLPLFFKEAVPDWHEHLFTCSRPLPGQSDLAKPCHYPLWPANPFASQVEVNVCMLFQDFDYQG